MGEENDKHDKEGNEMTPAVAKKQTDLREKLNKIRSKSSRLTGEGKMIGLNPLNPRHREWFEIDKYKGK